MRPAKKEISRFNMEVMSIPICKECGNPHGKVHNDLIHNEVIDQYDQHIKEFLESKETIARITELCLIYQEPDVLLAYLTKQLLVEKEITLENCLPIQSTEEAT